MKECKSCSIFIANAYEQNHITFLNKPLMNIYFGIGISLIIIYIIIVNQNN